MNLEKAVEILQYHQEWRLGQRHSMRHSPATLTEALDIALTHIREYKENIILAYNAGREYGRTHNSPETGEQYYQQTYQTESK